VHDHDPLSFNAHLARDRQRHKRTVVVPSHRLDRRQVPQCGEGSLSVDVAGVEDEVDAVENLEDALGQPIQELGTVRV
jgi:hypothetical protein